MDPNQPYMQNAQPQQAAPAPMPGTQQTPPPGQNAPKNSKAAMGIVSLVLGIIALLTSFLPIINNLSAILAFAGVIFGIVGIVITTKNKAGGKGISIAGLIINAIAFIVVLGTQSLYSTAIDEALSSSSPTATTASTAQSSSASSDSGTAQQVEAESFENLAPGTAVELKNGLSVSVDSVQTGLKNFDDSEIVCVTVTYINNGSSSESFNTYEWKGQDPQGAQRSTTYYSKAENELHSGSLAAGGSVTGNIYFDAPIEKVVYEQMFSFETETISWLIS